MKKNTRGFKSRKSVHWNLRALEPRLLLAADVGTAFVPAATSGASDAGPMLQADLRSQMQAANTSIVFIDTRVSDYSELASEILDGSDVVLLAPNQDGITQITQVLAGRHQVASIHILAHGESGKIQLGSTIVDELSLKQHASEVQQWSDSFAHNADIMLYGCETGKGVSGASFLHLFASLTGADVAASTNRTGGEFGDWVLETHVGAIESSVPLTLAFQKTYQGHLPIRIRAAGAEGDESMSLLIDGAVVQTWNNVGGDADARQFQTFTYDADGIDVNRISIAFNNDFRDTTTGTDRNLRVDSIEVDGVTYETEAPSVFSTGTWLPEDGVTPGFRESEFLHANGVFEFSAGSLVTVTAQGTTGQESFDLQIDGTTVQSFDNVSTSPTVYSYQAQGTVSANQVRVAFTNDLFDSENGIDRNLIVDKITIDGTDFETESPSVFSTGTYRPEDDLVPGFRESETLHVDGYFQFAADSNAENGGTENGDTENGDTGTEGGDSGEGDSGDTDEESSDSSTDGGLISLTGTVTAAQQSDDQWFDVSFGQELQDAIVVVSPASFNASTPVHARVRNVTTTGFQIQFEEWDYLNGAHGSETVSWIAVERGVHTLADGAIIEAGSTEVDENTIEIDFAADFDGAPVVIGQVASERDSIQVIHRLDDVTSSAFQATIQVEEQHRGRNLSSEDVHWIAFSDGQFDSFATGRFTADEDTATTSLSTGYDGVVLADQQTTNGSDTAQLRIVSQSDNSLSLFVEEERSQDDELGHADESIGWVRTNAIISASSSSEPTSNPEPTPDPPTPSEPSSRIPATYFVSQTGSDDFDAGQSQNRATPWQTIQRALDAARAGDTVIVADGTYREEIFLQHSGTADENIVLRAENPEGARILGFIHGRDVSYITVEGFDVTNSNEDVITQGIVFYQSHHITVRDNLVRDSFGGGIAFNQSDSILIEGNTTHGNAFFDPDAHSGISIYQPQVQENAEGEYGVIIRNNLSYNNSNIVGNQNCCGGRPTDGNGIVLDDYQNSQSRGGGGNGVEYDRRTLVENNITHSNGGNGIHVFRSHLIDIRNNTSVGNVLNLNSGAQINVSTSRDVNVYNNIVSAGPGENAVRASNASRVTLQYNIIDGPEVGFANDSTNFYDTDPEFESGTFQLSAGSVGIDAGRSIDDAFSVDALGEDRVVGRIDIGAVERQS